MRKNLGFTIIEMMIVIGCMIVLLPFFLDITNSYAYKQKATEYADQTKSYAKAFSRAITANYSTYYNVAVANPNATQVLKASQIANAGYLPTGVKTSNLYGQIPCAAIRLNQQSNQLEAMMFYVLPTGAKNKLTLAQGKKSVAITGGEAGMIQDDGSILASGWKLPNNSPFLQAAASCDASTLVKYSVAINLAMLPEYSNNMKTDPTLHRNVDNISGTSGGDVNNLNTMQTDITMQAIDSNGNATTSGIFFQGNSARFQSGSNDIFLGAGTSTQMQKISRNYALDKPHALILQNAGVQATTIQATAVKTPFEPCNGSSGDSRSKNFGVTRDETGVIAVDGSSSYQRQQLICTYNPTYCHASNPAADSCYLPINSVTIVFHPNSNSFDCSSAAGSGYYIKSGSYQMTGDHTKAGDEHPFCTQQWGDTNLNEQRSPNYPFPTAIAPTRTWQNVGCQTGTCCSWHGIQTYTITEISCTNDTTTFLNSN